MSGRLEWRIKPPNAAAGRRLDQFGSEWRSFKDGIVLVLFVIHFHFLTIRIEKKVTFSCQHLSSVATANGCHCYAKINFFRFSSFTIYKSNFKPFTAVLS
jgi:hypothetical protein